MNITMNKELILQQESLKHQQQSIKIEVDEQKCNESKLLTANINLFLFMTLFMQSSTMYVIIFPKT